MGSSYGFFNLFEGFLLLVLLQQVFVVLSSIYFVPVEIPHLLVQLTTDFVGVQSVDVGFTKQPPVDSQCLDFLLNGTLVILVKTLQVGLGLVHPSILESVWAKFVHDGPFSLSSQLRAPVSLIFTALYSKQQSSVHISKSLPIAAVLTNLLQALLCDALALLRLVNSDFRSSVQGEDVLLLQTYLFRELGCRE